MTLQKTLFLGALALTLAPVVHAEGVSASTGAPGGVLVREDAQGNREMFAIPADAKLDRSYPESALAQATKIAEATETKSELDATSSEGAWYYQPNYNYGYNYGNNYSYNYSYNYNYGYQPNYYPCHYYARYAQNSYQYYYPAGNWQWNGYNWYYYRYN